MLHQLFGARIASIATPIGRWAFGTARAESGIHIALWLIGFVFKEKGKKMEKMIELTIDPSADVAPVRHGRWDVIDAEEPRRYGCSECKRLSWYMENYCPNCGAKMDGDEDERV